MDASKTAQNRLPEKPIFILYRSVLALLTPVVSFYALTRVVRNPAYAATLRERLGFLPRELSKGPDGAIWVHAVSVGEVVAAGTLIERLRERTQAPIFLSTTTLTGYAVASAKLRAVTSGCFYAPIDYAIVVRRVLRQIRPSVVVVLETEIWPNLFCEIKRTGCGLILANGRISDRVAPLYRRYAWFFRHVLCQPDAILTQNDAMAKRFLAAGASPEKVSVSGNLKFDFRPLQPAPDSPVAAWLRGGTGPVLIAASTTADPQTDEDRVVLDAFERLTGWRLILAPRKPERFEAVAKLLTPASYWRRGAGHATGQERILLLDTVGELASLFPLADVVFMGGTLTATGGHNFLEPAFAGKPVIAGPHLENFREIAQDFQAHNAFLPIANGSELAAAAAQALNDPGMGARARQCAEAHRGAADATAERVLALYSERFVFPRTSLRRRLALGPFAYAWKLGSQYRQARELADRRGLNTPVISIGNITVGGTGKTPFVLHLVSRFREQGFEPVVLTRGYGRISHRERLILPRGSHAAVWHTGDEPQMMLRSGMTGLAVADDRYLAGWDAELALKPDIFVADDAFSHQRLERDVEIVLIDATDPFGGGELIPLGRLREPLKTLRRADIFVITRCSRARPLAAIAHKLRSYNERAPIFYSRIVTREWISVATGLPGQPPDGVVAFCGLGNPTSFWNSVDELGIRPLDRLSYGDHHRYAPRELKRLVRHTVALRARALVTTQKDVMNFPEDAETIFGDLPVFWLRVDVEIEREEEFLKLVNPADIRERAASNRRPVPARP